MAEAAMHHSPDEKNAALFASIDNLVDQTLQIYELSSRESAIIQSIDASISLLLNTLKTSLPLSPEKFHSECPAIKSAVLNSNGEIIIMLATGNIITKKFAELEGSQVMELIKEIVPKLSQGADAKKVAATEEITVLKKVSKQFQRVRAQPGQQVRPEIE
jgi:hypothetical protein